MVICPLRGQLACETHTACLPTGSAGGGTLTIPGCVGLVLGWRCPQGRARFCGGGFVALSLCPPGTEVQEEPHGR